MTEAPAGGAGGARAGGAGGARGRGSIPSRDRELYEIILVYTNASVNKNAKSGKKLTAHVQFLTLSSRFALCDEHFSKKNAKMSQKLAKLVNKFWIFSIFLIKGFWTVVDRRIVHFAQPLVIPTMASICN